MDEQVLHIIFPPSLLKKPIINDLIRKYQNLEVNILRADISVDSAWLEIQLFGKILMMVKYICMIYILKKYQKLQRELLIEMYLYIRTRFYGRSSMV